MQRAHVSLSHRTTYAFRVHTIIRNYRRWHWGAFTRTHVWHAFKWTGRWRWNGRVVHSDSIDKPIPWMRYINKRIFVFIQHQLQKALPKWSIGWSAWCAWATLPPKKGKHLISNGNLRDFYDMISSNIFFSFLIFTRVLSLDSLQFCSTHFHYA